MKFFPHGVVRKHQDEFVLDVEKTVRDKKILLANAPTGIGKTAAALTPALEYAIEHNKTVFFLTPRHTQHKIVVDTLKQVRKMGAAFSSADLIGKQHMCALPGSSALNSSDFSQLCKHLRENNSCKYYENLKLKSSLNTIREFAKEPSHVEEAVSILSSEGLCPYYASMEVAKTSKIIIGDYYHLFSESVRNSLFKRAEKELKNAIIIVDEAHNLPGRIRELLSARTTNVSIGRASREAADYSKDLSKKIAEISQALSDKGAQLNGDEGMISREWFLDEAERIAGFLPSFIEKLEGIAEKVREKRKNSYCGALAQFLSNWSMDGEEFSRLLKKESFKGREYFSLSNNCLDPSSLASSVLKTAHAAILMSGTLQPVEMYADLLGIQDANLKYYPSPFPKKNRLLLAVPETTTKYSSRSNEEFKRIADKCLEVVNSQKINSAIFFPSYDLRNKVYNLMKDGVERSVFLEQQNMTKNDKVELIERFKQYSKSGGAVLLGVISGNFSEGIDLPGNFLEMVIIVGIPLSKPDLLTKSLINHYDRAFGKGFQYAYTFPAINKVLQAAGRTIRSETDRGVIVLLDERYIQGTYLPSLPEDVVVTKKPVEKISEFFLTATAL